MIYGIASTNCKYILALKEKISLCNNPIEAYFVIVYKGSICLMFVEEKMQVLEMLQCLEQIWVNQWISSISIFGKEGDNWQFVQGTHSATLTPS
jgi:hypothetical protein